MAGAFIAIGHEPQSEIVDGIVETDEEGYVQTEGKSTRTNVPGVFGAGDLVRQHLPPGRHGGRLRLSGRARRRVVPARQPRCPDPRRPRGHRRPGRAAVGAGRALLAARARRRGPRGLRRRRRAGAAARRAGHDRLRHPRLQGRGRDPGARSPATARASRRRSRGAGCRRARSSSCCSSTTPTPPTALHALDRLRHLRWPPAAGSRRAGSSRRAPRTARTPPARTAGRRPARRRATTRTRTASRSTRSRRPAGSRTAPRPRRSARRSKGAVGRGTFTGTYARSAG